MTPSIAITEEYNSNILFTRRNELHDFITRVSPSLEGRRDTEAGRTAFDVVLKGEKYALNPELDTIDGNARLSWIRTWTPRFQSSLGALAARDQTLNTELDEIGVVAPREERNRFGVDGSVLFALTERWSLGGSFLARHDHYPDDLSPDLTALSAGFNPTRRITERDTGGVVLSFSRADYENNTLDRTVSAGLSWERMLSDTERFSLEAGYRYTSLDQEVPFLRLAPNPDGSFRFRIGRRSVNFTDDGFTFNARLEKDWTPRLSTSLNAGREHTSTSDATSVDRNFVRTATRFRLTERATLRAELGYDYTTELGPRPQDTHYFRGSPSVSCQITPHVAVSLGVAYEYAYEDRPVDPYGRDRFRAWISLSSSWPRLWGKLGSM